eukprot:1329780-Amorphochlora_amoeboformis.AAC.1
MLESRFRDFKFHTRSSILHSAAKPPFPYHDIGAFHWYRLLATHFFHPSIKLSKALITKASTNTRITNIDHTKPQEPNF